MAFTDEIRIRIDALFNDRGIEEARHRFSQLQKVSQMTGVSMRSLGNRADALGMTFNRNNTFAAKGKQGLMNMSQAADFLSSKQAEAAAATKKSNSRINNAVGAVNSWSQGSKEAGNRTQMFRMELLGLMFAGMALQRVTMGLLRPALKASGAFDIWGSILKLLFLPVAMEITDILVDILGKVQSLSEEQRRNVGEWVVFAAAIGFATLVLGQIGLALNSVNILLSSISHGVGAAGAAFTMLSNFVSFATAALINYRNGASAVTAVQTALNSTLLTTTVTIGALSAPLWVIIGVIGILVAAVAGLNEAWKQNLFGIRDITADVIGFVADHIGKLIEVVNSVPGINIPVPDDILGGALEKAESNIRSQSKKRGFLASLVPGDDLVGGPTSFLSDTLGGLAPSPSDMMGMITGTSPSSMMSGPGTTRAPMSGRRRGAMNTLQMVQNNEFKGSFQESRKKAERDMRRSGERASRAAFPFNTR